MKARIISVGSEILRGETVDTNSSFACRELVNLGFEVSSINVCHDDIDDISFAILNSDVEDLTIICGGLGPTKDDMTKEGFARAFNLKLANDEKAFLSIKEYFAKLNREATAINLTQAMLPVGSTMIPNSFGTAPGFSFEKNKQSFYCLPGVPLEFREMLKGYIIPDLYKKFGKLKAKKKVEFKLFGIPESHAAAIVDTIEKPAGLTVGFYPRIPEVHIRIFFKDSSEDLAAMAFEYVEQVRDKLKDYIFTDREASIEEILVDALIKNKLTLSVAESCTGGLLSSRIVGVEGSSACLHCGLVTYSNESKVRLLSVSENTIKKFGAVSKETALEMAKGVKALFNSDIGVSVTGIAGPGGATKDKPLGTTFISISSKKGEVVEKFEFKRKRNVNRELALYEVFIRLIKMIGKGEITNT